MIYITENLRIVRLDSLNLLREVEHTWAELSSRVEVLNKRIVPLIAFRDKIKFNANKENLL